MKKGILYFFCFSFSSGAVALENSMLNLRLPTALEEHQAQFFLMHRFYGPVDEKPFDTFLGMSAGANAGLGFRVRVLKNLDVIAAHGFLEKEHTLGAGYAFGLPGIPLRGQLDLQWVSCMRFSFTDAGLAEKRENFLFSQVDISGVFWSGRLTPAVNVGYDADSEKWGLGAGLNVGITGPIGLVFEYFPRLQTDANAGLDDAFFLGIKVQTYGHHFLFQVGNSTDIGTRRLMAGAPHSVETAEGTKTRPLYLGIGIQRLLEF